MSVARHHAEWLSLVETSGPFLSMPVLLQAFPRRQFVLVGDSGGADAEIYGRLARKFPDQVRAIYIRLLEERPLHDERAAKAFHRLPTANIQTFRCPSELPTDLTRLTSANVSSRPIQSLV